MTGCNEEKCTCPNTTCERHGKCCECGNFHREKGDLPICFRNIVNQEDGKA